jgi:exopolysaccharide biosynthesis protein
LPEDTGQREGFVDPNRGRDALGSGSPNARSAIGLGAAGEILLVMVAQRPGQASSGLTLAELAQVMAQRGAVQALNLDGGSSATLVYDGAVYHGRINAAGEVVKRPVKSILWVPHP